MIKTAQIEPNTTPRNSGRNAAIRVAELTQLRLAQRLDFLKTNINFDTLLDEDVWQDNQPNPIIETLSQELNNIIDCPRRRIIDVFALTPAEIAMLDFCVAVGVNPALEDSVSSAQGQPWRPMPTENLIKQLYGLGPEPIWQPNSALVKWKLVHPIQSSMGAAPGFKADPRLIDWYFGSAVLDEGLVGTCLPACPDKSLSHWTPEMHAKNILALLGADKSVRINLTGEQGSGRKDYAALICQELGKNALFIQSATLPENGFFDAYLRIHRFCLLTNHIPIWDDLPNATWPNHLPATHIQFILTPPGKQLPQSFNSIDFTITQPPLTPHIRAEIWADYKDQPIDIMPQFLKTCSFEDLKTALSIDNDYTALVPLLVNQQARSELENIGRIIQPEITWDDIILTPDLIAHLKGFSFEVRTRDKILSTKETLRIYKTDAALSAIFVGPPGVGKTMAAQCIASDLGVPLLIIDVARTVSKYIGETSKNLSRVFDVAKASGCILFFDEADAYFSKRTELKDSNDKYANADTNHLLQLIESYDGVLILATNKRANIDTAFFRRLRHCIIFRNPRVQEREILWHRFANTLFSSQELQNHQVVLDTLAERFEFTPAQIKSATLNAKYAALKDEGALSEVHLWQGVAQEMRKEGRSLPQDLNDCISGGQHVA